MKRLTLVSVWIIGLISFSNLVFAKSAGRLSPIKDITSGMLAMQARKVQQRVPAFRWLRKAPSKAPPKGKGRPVLLVPGFMSSDSMMKPLARSLKDAGYKVYNANISFNAGSMPGRVKQLTKALEKAKAKTGKRSVVMGHSLGGVLARTVASLRPDLVRAVVGIASPLAAKNNRKSKPTGHVNPMLLAASSALMKDGEILLQPVPKVPMYSIRAERDALIDPPSCVVAGGRARNIVVPGGHTGAPYQQKTIDSLLYKILPRL